MNITTYNRHRSRRRPAWRTILIWCIPLGCIVGHVLLTVAYSQGYIHEFAGAIRELF